MSTLLSALHARLLAPRGPRPVRLIDLLHLSRQRRKLAELDDHLLRDVGLTRNEAEEEARRRLWDVPRHWRV